MTLSFTIVFSYVVSDRIRGYMSGYSSPQVYIYVRPTHTENIEYLWITLQAKGFYLNCIKLFAPVGSDDGLQIWNILWIKIGLLIRNASLTCHHLKKWFKATPPPPKKTKTKTRIPWVTSFTWENTREDLNFLLLRKFFPLEKGWIQITQGCFVPSLVEISTVVLEKQILKFRHCIFAIS